MTAPGRIATALAFAVLLTATGIFLLFLRSVDQPKAAPIGPSPKSAPAADHHAPVERPTAPSLAAPKPRRGAHFNLPRALQIRTRFARLARQNSYFAIDSALCLTGPDRREALRTLVREFRKDSRPGSQSLADILEKIVAYSQHKMTADDAERAYQTRTRDSISVVLATQPGVAFVAARLANRLLTGDRQFKVLQLASLAYVNSDPGLSLALGSSLSGEAYKGFVGSFASAWGHAAPEAAAQWASSIPDADLRNTALTEAMSSFIRSAPEKAANWAAALPVGDSRKTAIQELGTLWGRQDTAAALTWTQQLPDPAEQQQALAAIRSVAPVGVGLEISRRGDTGYPVAMNLVPSGPAAQAGIVKRGEQIVAVSNSANQWLDTQNLSLEQVVSQIRGTPGQPVQLRLLPPGATDPTQARTVTIVRQQLLFKESL